MLIGRPHPLFAVTSCSVSIRPLGQPEQASFEDVRPGQVLKLPTSGDAGVREVTVLGRKRRLGTGRYQVDADGATVQVLRPPSSGHVTVHWVSHHSWRKVHHLGGARSDLARARAALAAAVAAQPADRHFRGLPESPEVIAAYDAVRAAESEVAKLERDGRRA